jgi:hypothetical protein
MVFMTTETSPKRAEVPITPPRVRDLKGLMEELRLQPDHTIGVKGELIDSANEIMDRVKEVIEQDKFTTPKHEALVALAFKALGRDADAEETIHTSGVDPSDPVTAGSMLLNLLSGEKQDRLKKRIEEMTEFSIDNISRTGRITTWPDYEFFIFHYNIDAAVVAWILGDDWLATNFYSSLRRPEIPGIGAEQLLLGSLIGKNKSIESVLDQMEARYASRYDGPLLVPAMLLPTSIPNQISNIIFVNSAIALMMAIFAGVNLRDIVPK